MFDNGWAWRRRGVLICVILAVLVALPGIGLGWFVDDYFHVAIVEKLVPYGNPLNLFDFAPGDAGAMASRISEGPYPWYTFVEMKARFFRPLSSLLIRGDLALFGRATMWAHLHSVLWYGLLVAGAGLILRRVLPGSVGALALLIFAVAPSHWLPVVWLANRNALVATVLVIWALYAHIRWREDGWKPGLPLSALGYAMGLLGGEAALGALAYLFAYEVIAGRGGLKGRVFGLMPAAVVGLGYLLFYSSYGYGAYGSATYIDPIREPLDYLLIAPVRVFGMLAGGLVGFPIDASILALWLHPVQATIGLAAVGAFAWVLRRAWPTLEAGQRRAMAWLLLGAFLSMAPVAATFPSSRLLLMPSLGMAVAIAAVLVYWWSQRQQMRGRALKVMAVYLIVIHLVLAPLAWLGPSVLLSILNRKAVAACMAAEINDVADAAKRHYVVVAGPDPFTSIYSPIVRAVEHNRPLSGIDSWLVLSQAPFDHRVTRTGPNTLEVEVIGGSMLGTEYERLFRASRYALVKGETVRVKAGTITVLETGTTGPSQIEIRFDTSMEEINFLVWKEGRLQRWTVPAVGQSVVLPRQQGSFQM